MRWNLRMQMVLTAAVWAAALQVYGQTQPATMQGQTAPAVDPRGVPQSAQAPGRGGRGGAGGATAPQTPPDPAAKPVFKDGQAQIVPGFGGSQSWIHHDLWVETEFDSDGDGKKDRMHVDVTRPVQTESGLKLPVIYESSPYFSGTSGNDRRFFWNIDQEVDTAPVPRLHGPDIRPRTGKVISSDLETTWVPRGFIVVHSEAPGSGLSEGIPTVGNDPEVLAPKAVIDWLNGRAKGFSAAANGEPVLAYWTTGKVGMTGTSYNGTLPVAAACTGVEGLAAIIPIAPNTSYYHYYRTNGLVRNPGGYPGEDIDYLFDYIHSGNMNDPVKRKFALETMRDGEMAKGQDRATGDYNEFWKTRDLLPRVGGIKCAVLMSHAFNDWNVVCEHSVRIYEAIKDKVPAMIYMHQGGHGGGPPMELQNKWFTRYLFEQQNDVEKEPRSWIVREGAPQGQPTPYKDYPNPDAAPVTLHLSGDGLKVGILGETAAGTGLKQTLVDDASISGSQLAGAAESNHRLLFATPKLMAPVHLSGYSKVTIKLASSKPAANLSVWMVVLPQTAPGGGGAGGGRGGRGGAPLTDNLITRGWADPQNYKALTKDAPLDYHAMTKGEPLAPGQFYEMTFPLEPDDQIIPAGKQIGLMIMSSDAEFTVHPKPGTELTVDLDGTSITLPVVGGAKTFEAAVGK